MTSDRTSPARPLRVGIVGSGVIAETHVPYIRSTGASVVGLADVSLTRACDFADRFNVQRVYRSLSDLVRVERPDVVHLLTPPHTHATLAIEALDHKVHVLVEKPMALEEADAAAMTAAAERNGVLLTVDHNRLFDPPMQIARQLYSSGALGELVAVQSYQAGTASERPWLSTLPGGGISDLIPHPLYLQLAFTGPVSSVEVQAYGGTEDQTVQELRVLMRGETCSGSLTISTRARPQLNTLTLFGTRMTVEVNLNNMTIVRRREYDVPKVIGKPLPNLDEAWQLVAQTAANSWNFLRGKVRYYPGMGGVIRRFYDAIQHGGCAPVTPAEGAEVVRVTRQIWRAVAEQGQRHSLRGERECAHS
jgi:predicted dehydrogenase